MTPKADIYIDSETLSFELDPPATPALVAVPRGPDRAAILRQVADAMASASSADEMLHAVFEDTKDAFGIDAYFNFMINDHGDALTLASHEGIAYEDACKMERLEFGRGICGNVALKRAPIVVTQLQTSDDPRVQQMKSYGMRSYACHPLMSDEHLIGTLAFASRTRERFGQVELDLFQEIARQVSIAYLRLRRTGLRRASDRLTHEFLTSLMQELRDPDAPLHAALNLFREKSSTDPDPALLSACAVFDEHVRSKLKALQELLEPQQPAVEPPVEEQPVIEQPVFEQAVVQQVLAEVPVVQQPVLAEPPVVGQTIVEQALAESPVIEQPELAEPPLVEQTIVQQALMETPVVEQPVLVIEPSIVEQTVVQQALIEPLVVDEQPVMQQALVEEPAVEQPLAQQMLVEPPVAEQPVVKEPPPVVVAAFVAAAVAAVDAVDSDEVTVEIERLEVETVEVAALAEEGVTFTYVPG